MSEAITTSRSQRPHPSDLVAMILGSDSITLEGFETPVMPNPWVLPGHETPIVTGDRHDGIEAIVASNRRRRRLHVLTTISVATAAFFLSLLFNDGKLAIAGAPTKQASSAWKIESILEDGVAMDIEGRQVIFRIGDTLPSGETLQDTDAAAKRFRTDHSVVTLRATPSPDAAAAPHGSNSPSH